MSTNTFGKYQLLIDTDTAQTVLELVRGMDFTLLSKAQVMALNGLQLNLEAITEADKLARDIYSNEGYTGDMLDELVEKDVEQLLRETR